MMSSPSSGQSMNAPIRSRLALVAALCALVIVTFAACGRGNAPQRTAASSGFLPKAQQGPETWMIDGAARRIDTTYYLALADGLQYTFEVPVADVPAESDARERAWPYIRHAFTHDLHRRSKFWRDGEETPAQAIGIAFVVHEGARQHGTRVRMGLDEIEARLELEGATGPSLAQLQGGWWSRCDDPAVEFLIDGTLYSGDFAGQHRLTLTGRRLVFEDGLPDGHAVELPHTPREFRVVDAAPGRLVLRQEPAEDGAGDWHLQACDASR
jgi:hypothetical protein